MDPVIFLEKVRRPDLRGLVRERLERSFWSVDGAGQDQVSVGLVVGPPGSGKTTFLSHVAAAGETAWYRVGAEDDDEVALTRHLGHTLGAALGLPDVVAAAGPGRVAGLVGALEDPRVRPVLLVVDDLHEIAGSAAERALERFVALRPRKIKIVLGSRRPPQLNTSRMLVSGELRQLDSDGLRFRSWEVEQLFRTVYAEPLSPEAAAALTRRTGGWAAGLQLFHLATAGLGRAEREQAVHELGGRSRLIRSYLARNVLEGLPANRRRFLLLTATLGVLTGELCDALLETSGSAAVLAELEREQFFTTSTDAGLTYHYHQVLQTHLEVGLVDELGGRAARDLYSRSAELLERAGRPGAAVRAHARAEDWGSVARMLKPDTAPVGDDALWGMLSLPGAPIDDPGLVLAGARRLLRNGQVAESVSAYRQAEALMDDREFRARCGRERTAAALWLPGAPLPEGVGPHAHQLQLSLDLRRLTRDVRRRPTATHPLVRGLASLLSGDVAEAARQLRPAPAATVGQPPGDLTSAWEPMAIRLAGQLTQLVMAPDELAAGQLEEIVLSADVDGWPWLSRLARGLQAAMLLAAAPSEWRFSTCTDLLEDLQGRSDRWSFCLTSLAVGAAYVRLGETQRSTVPLRRAAEVAVELGAPVLAAWARLLTALGPAQDRVPTAPAAWRDAVRAADSLGVRDAAGLLRASWPSAVRGTSLGEVPTSPAPASVLVSEDSTTPSGGVQLRCLGGFALAVDGAVDGRWQQLRPRARSLLMLLALRHRRQVHREQLVDALWPDATLSSGIRSLQVAVSSVRSWLTAAGLPEDVLRRHGDAYALELPGVDDQLARFEAEIRLAAREQGAGRGSEAQQHRLAALELYVGDLLPEVGPAEWVVEERSRLRLLAATLGADAAAAALRSGDLPGGLQAARRSVALDPYHDSSWTLLVEICSRLGDHSAAAVARRDHARVRADLGIPAPAGR